MELPDIEEIRALIMLLKDADVLAAKFGDIELQFRTPVDERSEPEAMGFSPPLYAGQVVSTDPDTGELEPEDRSSAPPAYKSLFPKGKVPTLRRPRGE
jgi:hypothetical protein